MWYDGIGSADNPDDVGCRSKTVSETYTTTVGELEGWPGIGFQWIIASCLAYSLDDTCTGYSSAEVQVNSIKIEFLNPRITHFSVSLNYFVGPNEEEWYGQEVWASVYHPEGSDQLESFTALDPTGEELTNVQSSTTSDSWNFAWWEGRLPNPPMFGTYTITATDKDGCVAEVTSWPTDHISDRVPTITDPINHGYVDTGVPTFRWEPFSDRTTGYLIEVAGPPEETLPDDDVVWRIGLPPSQTEVQFNCDGNAAVPELTSGNTYRLFVFAYEETCDDDEIQCYRDTSIRAIEFTVNTTPIASFTYSPEKPMVGGRIKFNASSSSSSDPDGEIVNYEWDFGDGTTDDDNENPEYFYVYKSPAKYTINLTVTDNNDQKNSTSVDLDLILEEGDLLLCRSPKSWVPGFWTHCGIYIGDNQVVEALGFKGVVKNPLSDWSFPNKKCVTALRVETDPNTRKKAANFAISREGRPFDLWSIFYLQKQRGGGALLSEVWYCSELVWAAYLSASNDQIDLDSNTWTICGGAVTSTEIHSSEYTKTLGEHMEEIPETVYTKILRVLGLSPVDLSIIDPDGLILNKQGSEIQGAIYEEIDIDEDGELDDLIAIPELKMGNYMIQVIPEPDAEDTDTYTLEVTAGDTTIVLAEDVQIRDIPAQPYVIESTETTINAAPVVDSNGPYAGNEGSLITFDASGSYDPDGSIVLYEWDFDSDGVYDVSLTSQTAIFTWGDDDTGTVKLRVTDNDGLSDTDTASITVSNVAPTAFFYVEQPEDFILPYHSLTFNGTFIDAGWLDTHTATWDFGDGTIISGTLTPIGTTTAEHAYAEPGTYTVTLTVTDDDGGVGDYEEEVTVRSAEEAAGIIIDQLEVCIVPREAPEGVSQKIESAIDKLEQAIDFLDQGKYCDAIGKLDGMITQMEGAIDQVNEQRCSVKDCKGKKCSCIADEDANELIESLEQAKQGAIAIRDFISAEHPECA
jgi:PKD repeat protein